MERWVGPGWVRPRVPRCGDGATSGSKGGEPGKVFARGSDMIRVFRLVTLPEALGEGGRRKEGEPEGPAAVIQVG